MSVTPLSHETWRALPLDEAVALLSVVRTPWWVAGGWAVDLYLGKVTRAHKDLDMGICVKGARCIVVLGDH